MRRPLNLRQVEAFKSVIENGTVSRAAEMLNISQPAVSKLIAHLEADTDLELFDRLKGRLAPTERGMRLYEEIDKIFTGVRQVENAVAAIRREEQGRLLVGVMPALSGAFIQRSTMSFLRSYPNVYCSIQTRSSQWIADWLVSRKLDVGLISSRINNPYIIAEPLMEHPLVCIMPLDHPLTARSLIEPNDLDHVPFLTFDPESYTGQRIATVFDTYSVQANVVLATTTAPTLCEFVAAGLGVSLVHPLFISGMKGRLAVRRFEPQVPLDFQLCRVRENRNASLIETFARETRMTAERISRELLTEA